MYNTDTTIVVSYLGYLVISITLTVWVARTFYPSRLLRSKIPRLHRYKPAFMLHGS